MIKLQPSALEDCPVKNGWMQHLLCCSRAGWLPEPPAVAASWYSSCRVKSQCNANCQAGVLPLGRRCTEAEKHKDSAPQLQQKEWCITSELSLGRFAAPPCTRSSSAAHAAAPPSLSSSMTMVAGLRGAEAAACCLEANICTTFTASGLAHHHERHMPRTWAC